MKPKTRTLTSDLSGVNAGRARLAADEQSHLERAANQRAAWQYLNSRYPPEQAAELADILGLTPDPRRTGHCDCGGALPLSATGRALPGYQHGKCHRCSNGKEPRPVLVTPGTVEPLVPPPVEPAVDDGTDAGTARCKACDRAYRLTGFGRLRPHPAWTVRDGVPVRRPWDCKGSGRYPGEVE